MFEYNKETHTGYVNGKRIPSITQLLELIYPMDKVDPTLLEQSAIRGTDIHKDIEDYNIGLNENCLTNEGKNYVLLTKALGLEPVESEVTCFIYGEDDEIIAFGHLDTILQTTKDIYITKDKKLVIGAINDTCDTLLYSGFGKRILTDIKTVSQFDNEKVALQTSFYSLARNVNVDSLGGIWVNKDIVQFRPLEMVNNAYGKLVNLVKLWHERND